jgi:AbrB family looped-hinge helix DNA binding protein
MPTVTGKYQITLPKRLVDSYRIKVGDEVELVASGETITLVPPRALRTMLSPEERLRLFDEATERQKARDRDFKPTRTPPQDRGWTRDELYTRGRPR